MQVWDAMKNIFREGTSNFYIFKNVYFHRINMQQIEEQISYLGGPGYALTENLDIAVVTLVLFEQCFVEFF